jgi:uncharacterized protein
LLWLLLGVIGIFVGAFGTLIGAAGGFLLVPILFFLYPQSTPADITSITLTVSFFNALSGSLTYGRFGRIDYRSGLLFSLASVPGAIIGTCITALLSRGIFQVLFGTTLLLAAIYLMILPMRKGTVSVITRYPSRIIKDKQGNSYTYSYSRTLGIIIAFCVGLLSGLLGIGAGIVHVPVMTQLLNFPVHIATATSLFIITITTFSAVIAHTIAGTFTESIWQAVVLSAGTIIGAQVGARLSQKVPGAVVVRLLAGSLAIVAIRLLIVSL